MEVQAKKSGAYPSDTNARLYIVRHGDTDLNDTNSDEPERFRAWGDPPLNDKGFDSAHEAGQFLANKGIEHIFHTDLIRGAQTAQVIHAHTGAPVSPVHGLRPWNIGKFTGQEVKPNEDEVQSYQTKTPDTPVPGGESFHDFQQRWHQTLHQLVQYSNEKQAPIAVVTHTRNLNDLKDTLKGNKPGMKSQQPPGGIARFDVRHGKMSIHDEDAQEGMKDEHQPFQE